MHCVRRLDSRIPGGDEGILIVREKTSNKRLVRNCARSNSAYNTTAKEEF